MMEATVSIVDRLDVQKIKYIDVDGVRTRYYEDGGGEPLVLIHGGQFGSLYSLDCWSLNLDALAKHFRVIALDKLGQGYTGNPKSEQDYTFEALLSHTANFLRSLGISQAHLVGHSRGGLLVACLALAYPELAKTLIVVDSNTLAPEDPQFPSGAFYADLARRTPPGPPTRETVRMEPDAQSFSRGHVTDDFVARLYEIALLPERQVGQQIMKAVGDQVWYPSLNRRREETIREIDERGLPVPTLVVWGRNDISAPLFLGLHLFERISAKTPNAELHVLNQAGHYCFREQPHAFNRLVKSFCL